MNRRIFFGLLGSIPMLLKSNLYFIRSGENLLTVELEGNVGLGTSCPKAKLIINKSNKSLT